MQGLKKSAAVGAALIIAGLVITAPEAQAKKRNLNATEGELKDQKLGAGASQEIRFSGGAKANGPRGGGNLRVGGGDWSPPPCWYAPTYTPKQLKKKVADSPYSLTGRAPDNGRKKQEIDESIRDRYTSGEYKDFNLKKQDEGTFWAAVPNPDEKDAAKRESCTDLPFWVKKGERPTRPDAISPKILAGLAYEAIRVPDTRVELNPKQRQTVNLPTWAWLDKGTFTPLSVTASVDLGAGEEISATTTAKPDTLRLQPGTDDATLHPASGECPRNSKGGIGTPYTKGNAKNTPPCGVTYQRATHDNGTYPLKATLSWKASWHGTDDTGATLPDGEFGTQRNITVHEVQSIN
ncbi:hypothetical protein OIE63_24890 [Streptomyces sp. NBC_01795]|uniref:hypothetical protein n=1 Tax=Streptomyces sp. NBC_01795 TaxID=2975943 RepID=UPI002DD85D24|nr:hypothetical protein [Streptomyces sp. NBC_01795]WSA94449.1 hypothetical protein OIE63_24890 [Streptomyces sp. NBC_01795]